HLVPGLVELHTDHLENHAFPRPKVTWLPPAAVLAYDAQVAAAGMTTVFDCFRAGSDVDSRSGNESLWSLTAAVSQAQARGLLRAEHHTHIRCEICSYDVLEQMDRLASLYPIALMSLMDHTPGARQFASIARWKTYYGGVTGLSDTELDRLIEARQAAHDANYQRHRASLVALANDRAIALASHDDGTADHVAQSVADAAVIAEFPTTMEAARLSHEAGIQVLMGAPNVVRGGSHSGNIAAIDLAREGLLDVLSSDYVPGALLLAAFKLADEVDTITLPQAIATVTLNPARAVGLDDRGALRTGLRGDVLRVRLVDGMPVVREVYREGKRVV
ncbi:MAG: alpha-D-ribose 1-methylphosphonate 5-triphosphate diphosphatase, partial [Pseudomonadota bacterium]